MANPFSTVDSAVVAALQEWTGFDSLSPRPRIQFLDRWADVREALEPDPIRPTIWVQPWSGPMEPRYTPLDQKVLLKYRLRISVPHRKFGLFRDLQWECNKAILRLTELKNAASVDLANPSPMIYEKIDSVFIDPLQDPDEGFEDMRAALELHVGITGARADIIAGSAGAAPLPVSAKIQGQSQIDLVIVTFDQPVQFSAALIPGEIYEEGYATPNTTGFYTCEAGFASVAYRLTNLQIPTKTTKVVCVLAQLTGQSCSSLNMANNDVRYKAGMVYGVNGVQVADFIIAATVF